MAGHEAGAQPGRLPALPGGRRACQPELAGASAPEASEATGTGALRPPLEAEWLWLLSRLACVWCRRFQLQAGRLLAAVGQEPRSAAAGLHCPRSGTGCLPYPTPPRSFPRCRSSSTTGRRPRTTCRTCWGGLGGGWLGRPGVRRRAPCMTLAACCCASSPDPAHPPCPRLPTPAGTRARAARLRCSRGGAGPRGWWRARRAPATGGWRAGRALGGAAGSACSCSPLPPPSPPAAAGAPPLLPCPAAHWQRSRIAPQTTPPS